MLQDSLKLSGLVKLVLTGPDGEIKDVREIKNLVTTRGKEYITTRMVGTTDGVMTKMGVGTGTTGAAAGNTALETALNAKVTLTSSNQVNDVTQKDAIDYIASFGTGSWIGNITEAGIFNDADVMLCRTTFGQITKTTNDTLTITWRVKLSAS